MDDTHTKYQQETPSEILGHEREGFENNLDKNTHVVECLLLVRIPVLKEKIVNK